MSIFDPSFPPDTALGVSSRFAWFHKTAPQEDVKFLGRVSPLVRIEAEQLFARRRRVTPAEARRLRTLWRIRATGRLSARFESVE